ncbi:MAG: tetratricopeptide repeat protein [Pyrinomonadaceae bacterium]|nr:tetratricopeptide repeat protein [Pyrinomonadaceae bacterium]
MKLHKLFSATALVLLILCFAQTAVFAKDEWLKIQSKNFQLYGNASEKEIRGVATKLEQFREAFRQIFPRVKYNSAIPTNVIVFKSDKSFRDYKPVDAKGKPSDWIAGYFQSGEDVNYIALSTEGARADTYQIIFHEYVHFLVDSDLGRSNIPAWFNEGIAEYYEQFTIENDDKVTLGGLDQNNLLLLQQNKLIPFETFFNIDNYSLHQQGSDGVGLFYAQAWALMHYLIQSDNGARNPQLGKFLNLVMSGKQPKTAFGEAFQTDYATMEKDLKKYVEQRTFRVQIAKFKNKLTFDADMKIAPMTESDAKATLGDLLFHTNRLTEAEAHLQTALTLDAASVLANTALGLIKSKQKNFADAKKYLEKAVGLDDKNYLTHYQYALVLSREGMTEFGFVSNYSGEQAAKMRESLKKSIALNPNFPENYNLYAFISYIRGENLDEAIEYLDKAVKAAPGNQWYQIRAAEIYLRKEDFTKARQIAQKVFETAADEYLRVYAKNTVGQINSYEAQLESVKNYNNRPPQMHTTDKPLTEEELARLNEQAMLEGINQTLRKPKTDEKRILGYLTKIECGKGIEYSVKVDGGAIKFHSENFDSLFLMSFDGGSAGGEFGCGTLKNEMFAVINYRPAANAKTKSAGEIVSIEFVPKNFKFLN